MKKAAIIAAAICLTPAIAVIGAAVFLVLYLFLIVSYLKGEL